MVNFLLMAVPKTGNIVFKMDHVVVVFHLTVINEQFFISAKWLASENFDHRGISTKRFPFSEANNCMNF